MSCALLLLTAACGRGSAVENGTSGPPPNSVGDAPGRNFDQPVNAAAAEAARKAAAPQPTDGLAWSWDATRHAASFGPTPALPAFRIACSARQVVIRRFAPAPENGSGTMSFTGNGRVASLPAHTVGDPTTLTSSWQAATAPSDTTNAVGRVFDGPGPVEIALPGTTRLVTRPSTFPARALAACRR